MKRTPVYGMMAEFDSAQHLVDAAHRTHEAGYMKIDAYSPFPVEGLAEAIGFHKNSVPLVVLIGGLLGGLSGYPLQYWISVVSYPMNVGGKPYHSWPAFIVVTFEMTILFGGISAVFGMLALNGSAHAVPSRVQCATLRLRDQRSILPDRVFYRSQVQPERNPPIS